ncbi:MAG: asparagine synthase (glutamine-hydrolyzing), partial [Bacteroidetes bacterium]
MCGICGIINFQNIPASPSRPVRVAEMNTRLWHRGPDEAGDYHDECVSLAMRRLSIIDLAGGTQPLYNETRNVLAFLNGEIYNYRELREELLAAGHQFRTQSDTEVLVHLYEEYGSAFVQRLRGMFAFCVYDRQRNYCLLARDPFGEKPLFYHHAEGELSFASELQALLANDRIPRRLNQEALPYYLRTSLVPSPLTFFADVDSLPPGQLLHVSSEGVRLEPYFRITYQPDPGIKSLADAKALIEPQLRQAVERQLVSDVPLGAFLSGGIDSSTIVALAQQLSGEKLKTFTVRFEEQDFDESPIARRVAKYVGTDHYELTVPNQTFTPDIFWMIIERVGQPFRDSSAIPSFFVSQEIRKHVKVALSGDGGD